MGWNNAAAVADLAALGGAVRGGVAGDDVEAMHLQAAILKPLVTALCLASGVSGGLLTPVMSTGAVLGGGLGILWSHAWPGSPVGAYALIGAAATIGAAMQAPITALAHVLEFTHTGFDLLIPMATATAIATAITRHVDGYSIYTARQPAHPRA